MEECRSALNTLTGKNKGRRPLEREGNSMN